MERLQKYMARCGVASRRKCEDIILSGRVFINNEKIDSMGAKVNPNVDIVKIDGKVIQPEEKKHYIMLNKPKGVITSVKDEKDRKTVLDLIDIEERIYPIGRLDYDTSGLLLLTNDGEIYNKIMHPSKEVPKGYLALIEGELTEEEIYKFCNGVDIGDYITAKAKLRVLNYNGVNSKVVVTIHEGKNRQVRRMFDAIEHRVKELKRISLGQLKLNEDLKLGKWRDLTEEELEYLRSL